jgi:hypothetical protein
MCVNSFRVVFSSQARTPLSAASPSTSKVLFSYFTTSLINTDDYLFILQEIFGPTWNGLNMGIIVYEQAIMHLRHRLCLFLPPTNSVHFRPTCMYCNNG